MKEPKSHLPLFSPSSGFVPRSPRAPPGRFVLATVVGAGLGVGAPCRADLVIKAPNLTVAPGSSGSFDVLITSTGGTFSVAGDDIELTSRD